MKKRRRKKEEKEPFKSHADNVVFSM